MGDGRYYSGGQFFGILFFTLIIIFIVISMMLSFYKGSGSRASRNMLWSYLFLGVLALARFSEYIVVSVDTGFILRQYSYILFIILQVYNIRFLTTYILEEGLGIRNGLLIFFKKILLPVFIVFLGMSVLDSEFLISNYTFDSFDYEMGFKSLLIVILLYLFSEWIVLLWQRKNAINEKYNMKLILSSFLFLWIIPLAVFLYLIWNGYSKLETIEAILYFLYYVHLTVLGSYFLPYKISANIFADARELILDYVFITDEKGHLVYKNKKVELSGVFKETQDYDLEDILCFFKKRVKLIKKYEKSVIVDNQSYYAISRKEIIDKDVIVGHMITFTDITSLILMLDQLRDKRERTEKANQKLSQYKDIVYDIEKEKEVNKLLSEIANNQQESMMILRGEISNLTGEKLVFTNHIDRLLLKAKRDLSNVRHAVAEYKNYYGGEHD